MIRLDVLFQIGVTLVVSNSQVLLMTSRIISTCLRMVMIPIHFISFVERMTAVVQDENYFSWVECEWKEIHENHSRLLQRFQINAEHIAFNDYSYAKNENRIFQFIPAIKSNRIAKCAEGRISECYEKFNRVCKTSRRNEFEIHSKTVFTI